MGAPETLPLNLEPESGIYRDPVAVLDFQSLYPSIVIAYNLCFSTSLGKVSRIVGSAEQPLMKMGALDYEPLDTRHLRELLKKNQVHVGPTGFAFVKATTQQSLLAVFLNELLEVRHSVHSQRISTLDIML